MADNDNYQNEMSEIWEMVRDAFRNTLSRETVELWFGDIRVSSFRDNRITLTIPSEFKCNIVRDKYLDTIRKGFCNLLGFDVQVEIFCSAAPATARDAQPATGIFTETNGASPARQTPRNGFSPLAVSGFVSETLPEDSSEKTPFSVSAGEPETDTLSEIPEDEPGVNVPRMSFEYTFDNFIIGSSNKFAHAACVAVAERPASNYNPLFIYGQSGLGKTHLMNAIINKLRENHPEFNIVYIKGDDFTNQLVDSLMNKNPQAFRDKYRKCDVLLIDDIQFIAGKEATQDEFFHTFNSLYEEHKQIILTSDRPPRDIKTLEDRLKSRFEWGLIADIQPPDFELRIAIIKKKAEQVHIELPEDVLTFLAENLRSNIRQIEGAIQKLSALSVLSGKELNLDLARCCISELLGGAEPVSVTVEKIFSAVQKKYGVKKEDVVGTRRTKEVAMARHISIYLIRAVTDMSLPNIGKIFDRDHSTVMSSIDIIKKRIATDSMFNLEITELKKEIEGH